MANARYIYGDPFPICRNCGRELDHYPGQWLRSTCGTYGCAEEFHSWDRMRSAKRPAPSWAVEMTEGTLDDDGNRDASTVYGFIVDPLDVSDLSPREQAETLRERRANEAARKALAKINREDRLWRETIAALSRAGGTLRTDELNRAVGRNVDELARVRKRMAAAGAIAIDGARRAATARLLDGADEVRRRELVEALDGWESAHDKAEADRYEPVT